MYSIFGIVKPIEATEIGSMSAIASVEDLLKSVEEDAEPPEGLSPELLSLWHTKKGNWDAAHDVAQDIGSAWGSWMHAHLHLIEGDIGNAGYWYNRAGKPAGNVAGLEAEWRALAEEALSQG